MIRVLDEFLRRRAAGETPGEEELLAAYPELADELREHLELVRHLQPEQERIAELIARGTLLPSPDGACAALLDGYQIDGVLGEGGMGIVLKAHDAQLGRPVALKILRPELARDALALARFEREARAAAALQHPNILTVHSVGSARGVHYIVMEYADGPSLAEMIRGENVETPKSQNVETRGKGDWLRSAAKGPVPSSADATTSVGADSDPRRLSTDLVRHIFRELLLALDAAHAAGLIHRDVKPSNILLVSRLEPAGSGSQSPIVNPQSPIVKLADFGLARMCSSQTQLTVGDSILGTPEYMSPEQARGDREIDHRTDLYSAGVVLYEMLTGRTPFKADTPTATIRRILDEEPEDPRKFTPDTNPNLVSLALRLMAKRPEDRLASATDTLAALEAARPLRLPESRRRLRRRLFGTVAIFAFALAATWTLWQLAGRRPEITSVDIDPDTRCAILVRRGDNADYELFHQFPPQAPMIWDTLLVDLDGRGRKAVVAGLLGPWKGSNVIAFDADGNRLWGLYLHDESGRTWPDCAGPARWGCLALACGGLDDKPGDELVVVGSELLEYPTRVSIVDPRTGKVRPDATFWHFGNLEHVQVAEDFFENGRPAIVAWDVNNKLDGFDVPSPNDPKPPAGWDVVPALMVLDPADMDGLGPPRTSRVADIPPARPHAYAFLDLAHGRHVLQVVKVADDRPLERRKLEDMSREQTGSIRSVNVLPRRAGNEGAQCFVLDIVWCHENGEVGSRAFLRLAQDLTLLEVVPVSGQEPSRTQEAWLDYWRQYWHPIIQNGEYVNGSHPLIRQHERVEP